MAIKKTKDMFFVELLQVKEVAENAELVAFIENERTLLAKKKASGKKVNEANESLKDEILEFINSQSGAVAVADIMTAVGCESNQRMTAMLTQLRASKQVVRTEIKRKAYYASPASGIEDTEPSK